ncbi:MAG TPA: lysophospholipid transporter LplT [Burkholderiaceae bacterium]|jgi:MFS family permease
MNRGFYTTMAAQFFSSLADNALLIACIAMLATIKAPPWMTPLLKSFFVLSYVLLAAFVGAFADAYPKGRVMFFTNLIKIFGCSLMFFNVHPLIAYGVVGFGAAAYSPAKYGILTELLPPEKLVAANGWIEGLTVSSIIFGTALGGQLVGPQMTEMLARFHVPLLGSGSNLTSDMALVVIVGTYVIAAIINLYIPDTGVAYQKQQHTPLKLVTDFANCCAVLWKDKLGQISLAVTTLFWGAGATLQFIVLEWGEKSLHMPFNQVVILQVVVVIGAVLGSLAAAIFVPLKRTLTLMPVGIAMGVVVMSMTMVHSVAVAFPLLIAIGALSGYFVVPMNALLQHRGYVLMSAGHSIAVQNFNENMSILTMLGLYAVMVMLKLEVNTVIIIFGLFVVSSLLMVMRWHAANQKKFDSVALIGEHRHADH